MGASQRSLLAGVKKRAIHLPWRSDTSVSQIDSATSADSFLVLRSTIIIEQLRLIRRPKKDNLRRRAGIVYLPLGLLGFIVMSYLGSVAERSKRGLYFSISWSDTRTFLA
jgi:hypothetical protein